MSSNPSYQQFGVETMNSCFINSSMIGAEAPFFHPNMPQDGSFGFGDPVTGADIAAHFMANNMMITSPANQLVCAAPSQDSHHGSMSSEEMNDAYVASESCSTVYSMLPTARSVDFQYGPSDVTIAQPSKMTKLTGEPQCSWIYDAPSATSIHEPYYLTGFSGTGFSNPFAASSAAASELSLRLGAKSSSVSMVNLPDQSSEVSCSGLTHVNSKGFDYQQPVKAQAGSGLFQPPYGNVGAGNELRQVYPQMYARPLSFSQVLSRSRYAHIAQEILNGVVSCLLKDVAEITDSVSGIGSEVSLLLSSSCSTRTPSVVSFNQLMFPSGEHPQNAANNGMWMEAQKLRNDLLRLLQMMDQKCNQCFDDIQNTASKFSSMVHSGGASGISSPFAHHAVSVMYRRLRKRIMSQIMVVTHRSSRGESSLAEKERSWESSFIQKHWALQQLRRGEQQPWRPQRGLPEKSVAVLKAWMFENFLRPYPKDNEKEMLAVRSGLSRSQVSNWFINARVRLWKPMIEEMYEEVKKTSGGSEGAAFEHLSSKDVVS